MINMLVYRAHSWIKLLTGLSSVAFVIGAGQLLYNMHRAQSSKRNKHYVYATPDCLDYMELWLFKQTGGPLELSSDVVHGDRRTVRFVLKESLELPVPPFGTIIQEQHKVSWIVPSGGVQINHYEPMPDFVIVKLQFVSLPEEGGFKAIINDCIMEYNDELTPSKNGFYRLSQAIELFKHIHIIKVSADQIVVRVRFIDGHTKLRTVKCNEEIKIGIRECHVE